MIEPDEIEKLYDAEVRPMLRGLDLRKAFDRRKKFEIEKGFAERHQTPDRAIFNALIFQPSRIDF
jgi:hypothetical protein